MKRKRKKLDPLRIRQLSSRQWVLKEENLEFHLHYIRKYKYISWYQCIISFTISFDNSWNERRCSFEHYSCEDFGSSLKAIAEIKQE